MELSVDYFHERKQRTIAIYLSRGKNDPLNAFTNPNANYPVDVLYKVELLGPDPNAQPLYTRGPIKMPKIINKPTFKSIYLLFCFD